MFYHIIDTQNTYTIVSYSVSPQHHEFVKLKVVYYFAFHNHLIYLSYDLAVSYYTYPLDRVKGLKIWNFFF